MVALAAHSDLLAAPPEAQERVLRGVNAAYPDLRAVSSFDADGNPFARSDGRPLRSAAGAPLYEEVRRTGQPSLNVQRSLVGDRAVVGLGAPVRDAGGRVVGHVTAALETAHIAKILARASRAPEAVAHVVDGEGRAIAHADAALAAPFADLSQTPPVAALLAEAGAAGALAYGPSGGARLAGYARVPGLGWGVVVERPEAVALASVRIGRDQAFGVLLVVIGAAVGAGVLTAGRLVTPLGTLTRAAEQLGAGATPAAAAALPRSGIREVERLAAVFQAMRASLTTRTAERDRAEAHLREANAQLERRVLEQAALALENARLYQEEKRAEVRHTAIVKTALDAIVTIDQAGTIVEFNPAAERMFGYAKADAVGPLDAEVLGVALVRPHLDSGELPHPRLVLRRAALVQRRDVGQVGEPLGVGVLDREELPRRRLVHHLEVPVEVGPAVLDRRPPDDGQAQPRAGGVGGPARRQPLEEPEDSLLLVGRDAGAPVPHVQPPPPAQVAAPDLDPRRLAGLPAVGQRVGQQVGQDLLQVHRAGHDDRQPGLDVHRGPGPRDHPH